MLRGKRGNTPRVQGFTREVTGKETGGNELAPPVANCCGGRGNILWRSCECLVAFVKRLEPWAFGVDKTNAAIAFPNAKILKKSQKCKENAHYFEKSSYL